MKKLALYVHIPFCKQKCYYCDFNSFANMEQHIDRYIEALCKEIKNNSDLRENYEITSIYFGGGTPSYIESKNIGKVLETIKSNYNINNNVEITIEINPGTVDKNKLKDYYNFGINRISFGVQSTNDEMLSRIGRIHNYKEFLDNFYQAREIGFSNISVDLIFGLPNQDLKMWSDTLEDILKLSPEHISSYSLKVEENTVFGDWQNKGELDLPTEEDEREQYYLLKEKLKDNGYLHYEISNFAKPGYESKHNLAYWERQDYLGVGSNSASCINNVRFSNEENIENYIRLIFEDLSPITFKEVLDEEQVFIEKIILGLRLSKGINEKEILKSQTQDKINRFVKNKKELLKIGLIEEKNDSLVLTKKGLDLANQVFIKFME